MLNILPRFFSRRPRPANHNEPGRARRAAEAAWSARTPCPTCGAFCLRASGHAVWCAWCELPAGITGPVTKGAGR